MWQNWEYPNVLKIYLTLNCNLNCRYCLINKSSKKTQLDFPALKRTIDFFFLLPGNKKTVSFTGGEPLLEYPLLKKIYLYTKRKAKKQNIDLNLAVTTNGTLLSKERCHFFEKQGDYIKISLDGDKKTHDANRMFQEDIGSLSFCKIIKNLKYFRKKSKVGALMVFTPQTVDSLLKNIKFLQSLGFGYIEFYPDRTAFWSKNKLNKLEEQFKQIRKYYISLFIQNKPKLIFKNSLLNLIIHKTEEGGIQDINCQKIHLGPDKNFYFCDRVFSLPEPERRKYVIGNTEKGVDNQKRLKLLDYFKRKTQAEFSSQCENCPWLQYCSCPIGSYIYSSSKNEDLKKAFSNFCAVNKLYLDNFLAMYKELRRDPLFIKAYQL